MSSVIVTADLEGSDDEFNSDQDMQQEEKKGRSNKKGVKTKGRGFKGDFVEDRYSGKAGQFDSVDDNDNSEAQKSVEGYIIFVTNVHEEAQEDDVYDLFADYGEPKQIHLNLDRRTGYVKGYALVEYETHKEAQNAITNLNGHSLLEQEICVDWAFVKPKKVTRRR